MLSTVWLTLLRILAPDADVTLPVALVLTMLVRDNDIVIPGSTTGTCAINIKRERALTIVNVLSLAAPKQHKREMRPVRNADLPAHAKAWLRRLRKISQLPPPGPLVIRRPTLKSRHNVRNHDTS